MGRAQKSSGQSKGKKQNTQTEAADHNNESRQTRKSSKPVATSSSTTVTKSSSSTRKEDFDLATNKRVNYSDSLGEERKLSQRQKRKLSVPLANGSPKATSSKRQKKQPTLSKPRGKAASHSEQSEKSSRHSGRYSHSKPHPKQVSDSQDLKENAAQKTEMGADAPASEKSDIEEKTSCSPDISVKVEKEASGAGKGKKGSDILVGAHCSIAGGLHKAVEEAVTLGGQAFGLFLRSQRTWTCKPFDPDAADKFKAACKEHGFPPNSILPHGSYLMNCGSPNPDTLKKSRDALLDELTRCEALGLTLYNFHPGSTCGEISVEESLDKIAESINWAHSQTKFVTTVIENMSCQGNTIGGRFEELKGIIDRVKDKSRIGVCLDTCHAFAAGFDLSSNEGFDKFVSDFHSIVGFQYLRAMHLNDSKGAVGCHLDRHENIGKGKIGIEGFRRVLQDPRFSGIPMILETPLGDYAAEIATLKKLI